MKKQKVFSVFIFSLSGFLIFLGFLLLFSSLWFTRSFGAAVGLDAVIFTLFSDMHGTDMSAVYNYLLMGLLPTLLSSFALITTMVYILPYFLRNSLKEKKGNLLYRGISLTLSLILFASLGVFSVYRVGIFEYLENRKNKTTLFEDFYVSPDSVSITFPEEKRNLIYIYLESMETTYADQSNGGAMSTNLIPQLTALAKNNINFSHGDGFGGGRATTGSTWTIASTVAQTSGVPFCLPQDIWENGMNLYSQVLPGLTTLSDILHGQGYTQTLMMGSDAAFAGQGKYYEQHNTDTICDLLAARKDGILPSDDYHDGFWGMEDLYLFEYAKKELQRLSSEDTPFALTLFTIDTHSPEGHLCAFCGMNTSADLELSQFEEVIACSDYRVWEFLEWLQKQDFYENTTVILVGDHNSMNNGFFTDIVEEGYTRRLYNCILNSPVSPTKEKNREFTTVDMFPTTLAALGCTIEGERLGLGVNLFSDQQTLCERYGLSYLNTEISKYSPYYNRVFHYAQENQ